MNVGKQELIIALSKELKVMIKKPEWAELVKTGVFKERPPVDSDWWYMRAASMLLKIQKLGPVGVSKLRTKYGGRKNMGVAPEHFFRGSGKIIRTILQQLEVANLLKQDKKGLHKGRVLTSKATALIAGVSKKLEKPRQKLVEKHAEKKDEAKVEPKKEEVKASPANEAE
jgi:small subunit ribosomal protein S19e